MKLKLSWVTEQEVKLVLVPVAFMFMRIWGVIRCILELYRALHHQKRSGLKFLVYMQAIGDPAQGWVNGIFFIILTKELRDRIFGALKRGTHRVCRMMGSGKQDCDVTNKFVYYNSIQREEILVSVDSNLANLSYFVKQVVCLFVCLFVYLLWLFVYILIIPCLILRKYFSVGAIFRFLSYYFR